MAFAGRQDEIGKVGSGEIIGNVGIVTTYTKFKEGLKGGLFAKFNSATGGIEPIDGSDVSILAGVVKRDVTGAIEDTGTCTADNAVIVDVIEAGLVTVETSKSADIVKFDPVYIVNQGGSEDGKATKDDASGNVLVNGYFYQKVDTNVWTIRIK